MELLFKKKRKIISKRKTKTFAVLLTRCLREEDKSCSLICGVGKKWENSILYRNNCVYSAATRECERSREVFNFYFSFFCDDNE
jgi:hypothetical protein